MTPPLECLTLLGGAIVLLAIALWMRDLALPSSRIAIPLASGAVAAILGSILDVWHLSPGMRIGAVLALAILLHLRHDDLPLLDAMAAAHVIATGAVLVVIAYGSDDPHRVLVSLVVAALAAALVLSLSARYSAPLRAAGIAGAILAAAFTADFVMMSADLPLRETAIVLTFLIPAAVLIDVFARTRSIARELHEEAKLGFFPREEIERTVHPFRRLGSAGWPDRDTRRRFVNLSRELALGRMRQRSMSPELARLYQLEILKLRMDLQDTIRVHLALKRDHAAEAAEAESSDTMSAKGGSV